MSGYQELSDQFGVVRNSWKRMMALSGMAIVTSEGIGILTVLILLDWLFKPMPIVRVLLWTVALGVVAYFLIRHVFTPLMKKIPDEQIALYIEEHRSELDGVLITAAEYSRKGERNPGQAALIAAVMKEASERSAKTAIRRVVDLSRLKKYSIAALAGVGLYVLASILFPDAVGHHLGRVLRPWQTTIEDQAKRSPAGFFLEPYKFTLSHEDTNLSRGATFDLEATLSRTADKPVILNFHTPNATGEWQKLPFTEIEKLNGFKVTLADVSEDLEFYVSCGGDKSKTFHISVYDPLVVQSLEVITHYPDYTKLPDRVERPSSGDVEALVDSKVTVRILTNVPLKEGQLKWEGGKTQSLTIDSVSKSAEATFDVKENTSYNYAISDAHGQQATSAASFSVRAVPDNPPTIQVKSPGPFVLTHPLGEINFDVEAADDFGVASVDLVYLRIGNDGTSSEVRVPLQLDSESKDPADKTAMHGHGSLMLEDIKPAFNPEDVISYHLEAHDTKGQKAVSEIGLITVGYFETWATWEFVVPKEHGPSAEEGPDVLAMLKAVWLLDSQKPTLAPADFQTQSKNMADMMMDKEAGTLRNFVNLHRYPQLARVADKINLHAGKAHEALVASKTDVAANELRIAAAIYTGGKLLEDIQLERHPEMKNANAATLHTAEPPMATLLELARLDALKKSDADKAHTEKDKNDSKDSAATSKAIDDLIKQQDDLIAKSKAQAEQAKPDEATPAKQQPSLAPDQKAIADKTKAAADAAKANPAAAAAGSPLQQAADKTSDAAKTMQDAARDFEAGKNAEALAKAIKARKELGDARDAIVDTDRDKLEAAITKVESRTAALLDNQREVRTVTEAVGQELTDNKTADQRQKRDLQAQAFKEAKLQGEAEAITGEIGELTKWAEQMGKAEAVHSLGEALRTIKRSQPEAKMANAIVELNNTNPAPAAEEEKKAETALEKILSDLRAGSDALAASREEKVRAAARAAAEAKAAAASLAGQQQAPAPAKGEQPAAEKGTQAAAGKGEQPAGEKGTQPAAGKGEQPAKGEGKLTEEERKAAAQKLAFQMSLIAKGLDQREIVSQDDIEKLKKEMTMDKAELEKRLMVDPKLLQEVTGTLEHISTKLEAEMEAKTEAKKLFSSQREECPPIYRQFVNKYFEALSQVGRPAESVGTH